MGAVCPLPPGPRDREKIRDYDDGLAIAEHHYTVTEAVTDWLTYAIPALGARKLRELRAQDIDR